jgi:N-acetylglucosaminyl-diphospho-decaprenol L-rhamnosyltransferase
MEYRAGSPPLSIIIITRNTSDLLGRLLASVGKDESLQASIREVIVIDNGSTDGTEAMVKGGHPSVIYVKNRKNAGFAAAANAGWRASSGEYLLFLNSDTILMEGEMGKMIAYMETHRDVAICGPQLVYQNMKLQRSFAFEPSLMFEVVPLSLLERLFPGRYAPRSQPRLSRNEVVRETSNHPDLSSPNPAFPGTRLPGELIPPREVDSLIGAAMVVRREAMEMLGGFDEGFFFFLEETDLCVRAREKGLKVVFFPEARLIHLQGKTVGRNWIKGRIEYNISLQKFIGKHHSSLYHACFAGIRILKSILFLLVFSAVPPFLLKRRLRRSYRYYLNLLFWYVKGCPETAGLQIQELK